MGTSTVERSPQSQRWRIVNALYSDPSVSTDRLLSEVFNAAEKYQQGLAEPAVLVRLNVLLNTTESDNWPGETQAALAMARNAVRVAQTSALRDGHASLYGDLADRALHRTLVAASHSPETLNTRVDVLRSFLTNLIGIAIDHIVSRDLTAHLGSARVEGCASALALRQVLLQRARAVAADEVLNEVLYVAADTTDKYWPVLIRAAWQSGARLPDSNLA